MKISTTPKKRKKGLTGQNLMTQCSMSISLKETEKVRQDKNFSSKKIIPRKEPIEQFYILLCPL